MNEMEEAAAVGAGQPRDYGVAGLRIRSQVPIAGWREVERAGGDPDVWIRPGRVDAPAVEGGSHSSRVVVDGERLVIVVGGVARYAAVGGREVVIDAEPGARPEDLLLYLTGAAFGAILHQRGVFPLHGSAVLVGGEAVALAGPSRAGKSTLAAALSHRGHTLVTDDVAALVRLPDGRVGVWAGAARVKLDPDALAVVQETPAGLEGAGGTRRKYQLPVGRAGLDVEAPLPLRCIYVLEDGSGEPRVERLDALEAIGAMGRDVYFPAFVHLLGLQRQWFELAAGVVAAVAVRRLVRPRGFEHMERVIALLEADWGGAPFRDSVEPTEERS